MTEKQPILKGPELLNNYEDNWETIMGGWFPGERVVLRGKDVFSELSSFRWFEYLIYGATGRESPKLARLIEGLYTITTSFPDPRLWNNRVAALAGTARSTGILAISAGIAVSEATIYGAKPIKGALDFLYRAARKKDSGITVESIVKEELKNHRVVSGFGRPIVQRDERIQPVLDFLDTIGIEHGKFVKLAFEVEDYFKSTRYRFRMNIAALNAAIIADVGLDIDEYYNLAIIAFVAGMLPCYIEAQGKPEGAFFPLSVSRLNTNRCKPSRRWGELK